MRVDGAGVVARVIVLQEHLHERHMIPGKNAKIHVNKFDTVISVRPLLAPHEELDYELGGLCYGAWPTTFFVQGRPLLITLASGFTQAPLHAKLCSPFHSGAGPH